MTVGTFNINDAKVNIFPNPFQDQIVIESTGLLQTQISWKLLDIMGREIDAGLDRNSIVIPTADVLSGTYFLRVEINDKIFIDKMIKI